VGTIDVGTLRTKWTGDTDDVQSSVQQASSVVKQSFEKIKSAGSLVTGTFDKVRDFGGRAKESLDKLDISAEGLSQTYGTLKNNFDEGAALAELGAASLRVEDRFNKFSAAAGGADEIMTAFQKGVGGTASEMDAMAISSGLLQAGLVKDAAGMERVTEVASRLGNQTTDVSSRIGEFSQLLKNQSIQLLDNFGISSGKVKERIKELQAETKGMTREEAFLTATFEQADAALAVLGPRTDDYLTSMERQQAAAANLEVEIGQKLAPAYAKVADFQANMNAETAIAIKGFQTGFGTAVELSGGIDKLAINFGKLASKMGTSSMALGGLGLGIGALVLANEQLQQQLDKMNKSFDAAEDAGSKLGTRFEGLTSESDEWGLAIVEVAAKLNNATEIYDSNIVTGTALGKVFGADAAMADTMSASLDSVNAELMRGSSSYGNYIDNVLKLNSSIKDSDAKMTSHLKTVFEATKKEQAAAEAVAAMTDEQRAQWEEIQTWTNALSENKDTLETHTMAEWDAINAQEAAHEAARERLDITGQQVEAETLATQTIRDEMLALEGLTAAETSSTEARGAALVTTQELALAEEQQTAIAEKASRVADMQAESALRTAEAFEIERDNANKLATETANLAISLKDATEADIAKRFIGMLDPEKMGAKAYTKAVTDIGLKSGIMDETSVRLATDMAALAVAVNDNVIPMDDVSAALDTVSVNAETGEQSVEDLIDQFKKAPSSITPVGNALQGAGEGMATIASQGSNAALMIDSFGESTQLATPKLKGFQDKLSDTESNLIGLVDGSPWVVTVTASTVGGDDPGPGGYPGGASSRAGDTGGTNVEEMNVTVQVVDAAEVEDTFEGMMAWAGRSG